MTISLPIDTTNQGFSNRVTHLVSLWLNNEWCTYKGALRLLKRSHPGIRRHALEEFCRQRFPAAHGRWTEDMVSAAMDLVNWHEVLTDLETE